MYNPAAMETLQTVEIETGPVPVASIVWLHGLGADGHDFEPIVPELGLPRSLPVRFVFPHAPVRPVTLNGGMPMRAWYDIVSLDREAPADEAGIEVSRQQVTVLLDREVERGVSPRRLVLAGFSQGGAVALTTALTYSRRLAGIVGLSTWLPRSEQVLAGAAPANVSTPVFLAHGSFDPVVLPQFGQATRDALTAHDYPVTWREYPMQHAVSPSEISDLAAWLREVLS